MIKSLNIRNFAVIESAGVEFQRGLNLLTGETGSGKSMIVDALGLLLGERVSLAQIRTGEASAFIEGLFAPSGDEMAQIRAVLDEAGIELEGEDKLIVRREMSAGGKSRIYINDRSVTLVILRKLQPLLVEIHGQGEQKLLLSPRAQLELLDDYAGCEALRQQVGEAYLRWKDSFKSLDKLREDFRERERSLELLNYQLAEIDAISPQEGEDERLAGERRLLAHAEKILQLGGGAYEHLYESDGSVLAGLSSITKQVRELCEIDARLEPLLNTLNEGAVLLREAADAIRSYLESVEFSPDEFARVDNRLNELERLKRKFGTNLVGLLEIRENTARRLSRLADLSQQESRLKTELSEARELYLEKAAKMTARRKAAARKLASEVVKDLQQVALPQAQFAVDLKTCEAGSTPASEEPETDADVSAFEGNFFSAYGADRVSFLFSANPGESLRPLSQAASGGELSRLMLTLLTVSMKNTGHRQGCETIIFDEIDAGIGGRVAEAVGRRLKALAKTNQVLCVTHQAQIARFAEAHFSVEKVVRGGRTLTSIEYLEREARVKELARMIAGEDESQTTFETARRMLETAGT
jgi:DNA repair protein RecN (Recombination protein N)